MREILYRAKAMKEPRWVYGDLLRAGTDPADGEYEIMYWDDESGWMQERVDPATIGQFTGCLDKNNMRIFEGDIVECVSWSEYFTNPATGEVMQPFRRRMYVAFQNGGFKMIEPMPYGMKDNVWDIIYNGDIRIIGNMIYHPELLKKDEPQ